MSSRRETLKLRLELLRMRGELERGQAVSALVELRSGTQRLRRLASAAGTIAGSVAGSGGWPGRIAGLLGGRPWLAAAAVAALGSIRRHPLLALAVAGAVWLVGRRLHAGHENAGEPPVTGAAPGQAPESPRDGK